MNSEHTALLKSKIAALSGKLAQAEAHLEGIIDSRLKATQPNERSAFTEKASLILAQKHQILKSLHTTKRLLARSEGDEFDFDPKKPIQA